MGKFKINMDDFLTPQEEILNKPIETPDEEPVEETTEQKVEEVVENTNQEEDVIDEPVEEKPISPLNNLFAPKYRPKKKTHCMYLDEDVINELTRISKEYNMSVSEIVNGVLKKALDI